jgi:hypothetical protein
LQAVKYRLTASIRPSLKCAFRPGLAIRAIIWWTDPSLLRGPGGGRVRCCNLRLSAAIVRHRAAMVPLVLPPLASQPPGPWHNQHFPSSTNPTVVAATSAMSRSPDGGLRSQSRRTAVVSELLGCEDVAPCMTSTAPSPSRGSLRLVLHRGEQSAAPSDRPSARLPRPPTATAIKPSPPTPASDSAHVPAPLARRCRRPYLRIPAGCPWAADIIDAFRGIVIIPGANLSCPSPPSHRPKESSRSAPTRPRICPNVRSDGDPATKINMNADQNAS